MHRQSLGSPPPNHHLHHTPNSTTIAKDITATPTPSSSPMADKEDKKPQKKLHRPPHPPPAQGFVHFIPILILLCFLILYLSSHHPSPKELAQFNGFKRSQKPTDNSLDGMEKTMEVKKGYVLAIGSLRNLQEVEKEEIGFERSSSAWGNRRFLGRD